MTEPPPGTLMDLVGGLTCALTRRAAGYSTWVYRRGKAIADGKNGHIDSTMRVRTDCPNDGAEVKKGMQLVVCEGLQPGRWACTAAVFPEWSGNSRRPGRRYTDTWKASKNVPSDLLLGPTIRPPSGDAMGKELLLQYLCPENIDLVSVVIIEDSSSERSLLLHQFRLANTCPFGSTRFALQHACDRQSAAGCSAQPAEKCPNHRCERRVRGIT